MTHLQQAAPFMGPACGMDVDPATAKHTSEYLGETSYFCSLMCLKALEHDPQHYLRQGHGGPAAGR